ncbi:SDR family oxidoreductase, partial [Streptomyces sp. NPDC005151]
MAPAGTTRPGGRRLRPTDAGLHADGHRGAPQDIAYGVLHLASEEARFVTGTELVVDGGCTAVRAVTPRSCLRAPTALRACRVTFDRKADAVWCVRFQGAGRPSDGVS